MHRLMLLTVLLMLVTVACGGQSSGSANQPIEPDGPAAPDSPQAFIDRLSMAMEREGQVLQMTIIASGSENGAPEEGLWRDELWIYAAEERARHLYHLGPPGTDDIPAQATFLIVGNRTYSQFIDGAADITDGLPARTCPLVETSLIVHHVVGDFCSRYVPQQGEAGELTARIEKDAEFDGTRAVALVYEARNELEPNTPPEPERLPELTVGTLYLDAGTWLPLGWTVEMIDEPTDSKILIAATYTSRFIPRDRLPADSFDPPTERAP